MDRTIILTADGSHSISVPQLNVIYHSVHGAIQESQHVFIQAGLYWSGLLQRPEPLSILEVGFGTGLNALLTAIEAEQTNTSIYYAALEPFPVNIQQAGLLNYCSLLNRNDLQEVFIRMHQCEWNINFAVTENFLLHKSDKPLQTFTHTTPFNIIYFDAFAPSAQPELWTKKVFGQLYTLMTPGGILVTYCSKGEVRRAMRAAGFTVEKIPGPKGKREMVRAAKGKDS